ncbi:MAG: hypothetical protein M1517_07990, partial [Deltaproteobacteria bacterium]|nr:hypothetical protein [Deltaproteobacteria bacterium]
TAKGNTSGLPAMLPWYSAWTASLSLWKYGGVMGRNPLYRKELYFTSRGENSFFMITNGRGTKMRRSVHTFLFVLIAAAVSACSTSTSSTSNFTYPSSMVLGSLPSSTTEALFVANMFTGTVSEINTSTNTVMGITTPTGTYNAIPLDMYPDSLEYSNGHLYIAGFTQSTAMLESLDLADNQITGTEYLKGYPLKTLLIHRTSMLYVLDAQGGNTYMESFTVGSSMTPAASVALDSPPSSMTTGPDDGRLFLSFRNRPIIDVLDPHTLEPITTISTDYPVASMRILSQYDRTLLYAVAFSGTAYIFESIDADSGSVGYEFTIPGIPKDFAITPQRVLLDDNHFSYLGIVANADGYLHFLDIDHGCSVPSIPSSYTGLRLTSSVPSNEAPSIQGITTDDCTTQSEAWSVVYDSTAKNYAVAGTASGLQPDEVVDGAFFDSIYDRVSFYMNPGTTALGNDDMFTFDTTAAQGIKTILGLGLPEHVIIDPETGQAYVSDILTNAIYVVSPATQGIVATIK